MGCVDSCYGIIQNCNWIFNCCIRIVLQPLFFGKGNGMSIIKEIDDQIAALRKKKAAIQKKCSHPAVKSRTYCDEGNILTGRDPSCWTDHTCELCGYQWQTEKKNG
jgi:hypothetical protein